VQRSESPEEFQRVIISPPVDGYETTELREVLRMYMDAINLRQKYVIRKNVSGLMSRSSSFTSPDKARIDMKQMHYEFEEGIVKVWRSKEAFEAKEEPLFRPPVESLAEYYRDVNTIIGTCGHGPAKTHAYTRLSILEAKFNMHRVLNADKEKAQQKSAPRRDFYNVYKVDTHIHLSSAMNQKHLLKFIKKKLQYEAGVPVIHRDGKLLTLEQVFESLQLTADDLSVDRLDVHADNKTFHRFDKFNLKYNPVGESRLREIFLKTDNFIKGRYLAEMVRELITSMESSKYQCAEWRLSIYGRSAKEWDSLAAWVMDHKLTSDNVRYLVQIPRLYDIYRANGTVTCFQELLSSIFEPLFAVSKDPSSNPKLHKFLEHCVGFDCVDDESKGDPRMARKFPPPTEWNFDKNPAYTYYLFYLWANITSLNQFRASKGLSQFSFRPHSGEAGEMDHLVSAFLLANGIAHGINLRLSPVLQYLFYLTQIPIAMSPLSNNSLFIDYSKNPFPIFYARGLNVCLSTDDPLQFHYTKEPLIEEYSVAAQVWKFASVDICEIARSSVLQSDFPTHLKTKMLGPRFSYPDLSRNDMKYTNVPSIRMCFRDETLVSEIDPILSNLMEAYPELEVSYLRQKLSDGAVSLEYTRHALHKLLHSVPPTMPPSPMPNTICEGNSGSLGNSGASSSSASTHATPTASGSGIVVTTIPPTSPKENSHT
jgi:AMP deaminase